MSPMEPVFGNPPPVYSQDGDAWMPTADILNARPGEWALICEDTYTASNRLAGQIRDQRGVWSEGRWEVVTRKVTGSHPELVKVWARFMLPASPDAPYAKGDKVRIIREGVVTGTYDDDPHLFYVRSPGGDFQFRTDEPHEQYMRHERLPADETEDGK